MLVYRPLGLPAAVKPRAGMILAAFCVAAGCKAKVEPPMCHAYLAPGGKLSPDDVSRLERSAGANDPCPALGAPALEVGPRGAVLDGNVVVLPADLPVGKGRRVDPLFDDMRSDRDLWKRLHPGRPFGPVLDVTVAPDVDVVAAASVLYSASLAGYPQMRLHAAGGELSILCARPLLGATDIYPMMLRVAVRPDGRVDVHFERLRAPMMPPNLPTPASPTGPLPDGKSVAAFVEGACASTAKGCVDVLAVRAEAGKFEPVVRLAREVLGAGPLVAAPPLVTFEVPGLYREQPAVEE
jgi:hypothetical protein